jgi:hypothetical protein
VRNEVTGVFMGGTTQEGMNNRETQESERKLAVCLNPFHRNRRSRARIGAAAKVTARRLRPDPARRAGAKRGKRLSPELETGSPVQQSMTAEARCGPCSAVIDRRRIPFGLNVIPRDQEA